jgi:outer membrane protein OmpA-like peptidoglycan-associated protein
LAGPPALPAGDPSEGAAPAEPEAAPAEPAPEPAAAPADAPPADDGAGVSGGFVAGASVDDEGIDTSGSADGEGKRGKKGKKGKDDRLDADDPGVVRGRREHLMPQNRGAIGLFNTALPDVGGKYTFRFRLHTDFFRKEGFMYKSEAGDDKHARVRGGVTLGFTPFEWGELFFSVNSQANRNERNQEGRQDQDTMFALGDIDFGAKGAHRFKNGIGLGGQVGLGLLSGSERLFTDGVNFWIDGLFAVDVRYLTKKQFPFRFTTNIGWMLDNSLTVADFGAIRDDVSREVTRFSLGANHNRLRMRYAVDFPIRLGKERQFGIDPIIEWAWDVSTQEEILAFGRGDAEPSPLPRSSQWLTLGLRANVVSGLHVDAAADIGMVSPSFEFGPAVPPWQVTLGLGWSFDPNPIVKEVAADGPPPPPPAPQKIAEGRIVGQVVDASGAPVPDARVSFPGLTSTAVVTDANGNFTSFRFPAGQIPVQVSVNGQMVSEAAAEVADGEDTPLTIQLTEGAAVATGIMQGAIVDANGAGVAASMQVVGNGVDQAFPANESGLIALELNEGQYRATVTAPGYNEKTVNFTVTAGGEAQVNVTLEAAGPVETPNVSQRGKSIRLKGQIRYDGDSVSPKSHALLDELAVFIKGHTEIGSVLIGVHTDDQGAAMNRSTARADSVKAYLVSKGVSSARLNTKGYGASRPVAVNMTAAGRAKNNRTVLTAE